MIPFFSPVMISRGDHHGRMGEIRGATKESRPRYDVVLDDGRTVLASLSASDFAVTGKPRQVEVIAWEGTAKSEAA